MGAMVPRGPLSHAPTEGRGQRLLEGGHRRVGTPAPLDGSPLLACYGLLSRSGSSSSTWEAIIA
jgi:hypothetical protein